MLQSACNEWVWRRQGDDRTAKVLSSEEGTEIVKFLQFVAISIFTATAAKVEEVP